MSLNGHSPSTNDASTTIVSDDIDEVAAKGDDISDEYVCDSSTSYNHDNYDILHDFTHLANVEESFEKGQN